MDNFFTFAAFNNQSTIYNLQINNLKLILYNNNKYNKKNSLFVCVLIIIRF